MKTLRGLGIVLAAAAGLGAQPAVNPARDLLVYWPSPGESAMRLLREIGADVVISPPGTGRPAGGSGQIRVFAELPPDTPVEGLAAAAGKARAEGYDGAVISATGEAKAFQQFVKAQAGFVQLVYLKPDQLAWDVTPAHAVVQAGTWPGLHRMDSSTSGATERPWLDANLHVYAYLRSRCPGRVPVLSFRPDKDAARFEPVEVALAEAFAAGGNAILSLPETYRDALSRGEERAVSAWRSLGRIAAFVKQHTGVKREEDGARTAVLAGDWSEAEEILNLAYRNNLAPRVLPAQGLPPFASEVRVIAAVNLPVTPDTGRRLLEFARAGGMVFAAPVSKQKPAAAWWASAGAREVRSEAERSVLALGKGAIYVYRGPVQDPAEFAMDLREAAGGGNPRAGGLFGLDFRIWNSGTILGALHRRGPRDLVLILTSYGSGQDSDFLVGVRGRFHRATMEQPGGNEPAPLQLMPREGRVELDVKRLGRLGVIVLQGEEVR